MPAYVSRYRNGLTNIKLLFVLFVSHLERGMAEIEGSGGSTRTNEARCHGEGSYRAVECTRRSSASIAGITSFVILLLVISDRVNKFLKINSAYGEIF